MRAALEKLQLTSPHAVADRLRELSYLANIVVQSLRRNGAALVAHEASEAVVATASLGLAWLHVRDPSAAARALHSEPGAVRLFGIGWCLIGGLPARVVSACELAFAGEAVTARLARRNWMRDEVERALDDLRRCVREQAFVDAREALTLLSLVFDPSTCRALRPVLDEVPRISMRGHVPTVSPADASDERARWISGLDDLRSIAELLQRL